MKFFIFIIFFLFSKLTLAEGYDVFGLGYYDIKFDGSQTNEAIDFRYERRFDYSLFQIGPDTYDFFNLAHINEKISLCQRAKFLTLSLNIFPECR